jgi:opine dehydrogenase
VESLKYALIGLGGAGSGLAVSISKRGGAISGWYDVDPAIAEAIEREGGLSYEGLLGTGAVSLPKAAANGAEAVQGADIIIVSTTANVHADVAREIAPALTAEQAVILHCGYVAGTKVFQDQADLAGISTPLALFEMNNTLHLAGKLNPSTVVVKGEKKWLEIAGSTKSQAVGAFARFRNDFPEFTASTEVLANGLNNPNCFGHVPATIGAAVLLDREMGDLTTGTLQFEEARLGRVNRMAAALEAERDTLMSALGLQSLSSRVFSKQAYPAGSRQFGGIARFGPKLQRRFLYEDVPCSLVPMEFLGHMVGVAMPVTTSLIEIANILEQTDFRAVGRRSEVLSADWVALNSKFNGNG